MPASTVNPPSETFIRRMPKVELHVHIEGTLEPEMMFALANNHGILLPWRDLTEVRQAYDFADLQSFLDVYYRGAAALRTSSDFYALASAYLHRAAGDGVRHAEIFFDPQTHTGRGISLDVVVEGLEGALSDAARTLGISAALIPCFLRHLPADAAMATYDDCRRFGTRFVAFGLDSSERDHPPEKFTQIFERVRTDGYRVVAHAGEEGPASYITEALDRLGAHRIDHGVRALEDPQLVERLVRERIPLTVCPLSNVRLRVFPELKAHNLRTLLHAGVVATVNSDDPAYFGGYISDNFVAVAAALQLTRSDLHTLAQNAIEASFVAPSRRAELNDELTRYFASVD